MRILKEQLKNCENGHIIFEYTIPRMGKRVDVVIIRESVVFVIEFKVNETEYLSYAIDQAVDYTIDLKNFQEGSHFITLVPILIATEREQLQREQTIRTKKHLTLDELGRRIALGDFKELNIILKGDVDGS